MAEYFDVVVIGAGQAGLAMSHCLSAEGIDHIVLERGAIANRWRAERWRSLRLLTPNWMSRLPGFAYDGPDPDGFMAKAELVEFLTRYADSFDAPVRAYSPVRTVTLDPVGYRVETLDSSIRTSAVVIATGACDQPKLPDWAPAIGSGVTQVTTQSYKTAGDVPEGGVLVVGGSATGVQLAEELHLAGRSVTLATGAHVPLPRQYRGRDIMHWMDRAGILSEPRDPRAPAGRALSQPSLQLVGSRPPRDVGLGRLHEMGVRVVGRATGVRDERIALSGTLATEIERGQARRERLLTRIDAHIRDRGIRASHRTAARAAFLPHADPRMLDLAREGIGTVVWATGFRRDYSWLRLPVLDAGGELRQQDGVTALPGLYAMALPFMRRRNSTFIDGVGQDARDLTFHLCRHLGHGRRAAA